MKKLDGYPKIAVAELGYKKCYFAIFDDGTEYKIGDKVLVSTTPLYEWNIITISDIIPTRRADKKIIEDITHEVICKVQMLAYANRINKRKKIEEITKKLEKRIKQLDEEIKYNFYASIDSMASKLYNELKALK